MSASGSLEPRDRRESWHAALHRLQQAGEPHALASIVGAAGSTPREPGAKLVVTADGVIDTLGGGHFEQQVIEIARERLSGASPAAETHLEAFPLGGRSGQCCGGFVHVLIEVFPGAEQRLALFGAGHVGQALVELLSPLPWRIEWFDSRADAFPHGDYPPRVRTRFLDTEETGLAQAVASLDADSHVLVMTHDHALDRELIQRLLQRDDLRSLGLIGSASKWASFRSRLIAAGVDEAALTRVRCPVGLGATAAKRPREIAISVAAELLALSAEPPHPGARGVAPETLRDAFAFQFQDERD